MHFEELLILGSYSRFVLQWHVKNLGLLSVAWVRSMHPKKQFLLLHGKSPKQSKTILDLK